MRKATCEFSVKLPQPSDRKTQAQSPYAEKDCMEIQFHFKNMNPSNRLTDVAQAEFLEIGELVLKDTFWNVTFIAKKNTCEIEVYVRSGWGQFKATSEGEDFLIALSLVSKRIEKQILKKKSRLQAHKLAA